MDSLYLLIPVALVLVALGIKLLLWAIDSGQYDDLDKEAWRILAEERPAENPKTGSTRGEDRPISGGKSSTKVTSQADNQQGVK